MSSPTSTVPLKVTNDDGVLRVRERDTVTIVDLRGQMPSMVLTHTGDLLGCRPHDPDATAAWLAMAKPIGSVAA